MDQQRGINTLHVEHRAGRREMTWLVICTVFLTFGMGCGGPRVIHLKGTSEEAIEALTETLDAWKSGQTPDELRADLSILARDYQWDSRAKLHAFTIEKNAKEEGPTWRVDAFLTFGSGGVATTYPIQAAYSVTLEPSIAVFRMDHTE